MRGRRSLLVISLAVAAACDPASEPLAGADGLAPYRPMLALLEDAGYRGPVLVQDWKTSDRSGESRVGRTLALPVRGLELLDAARASDGGFDARLRAAVTQAQEVTDPEQIDPANNSLSSELQGIVIPSVLNGPSPTRSEIRFTNRFISFDFETDQFYFVQAAEVLASRVLARDRSAGHFHGTDEERSLRGRVGWLDPEAGTFSSGTWSNTWKAPEYAQEVWFEYDLREIGGPNDGDENTFFSIDNSATRFRGLARIPAPTDGSYVRVGGTTPHPEDFNDWAVSSLTSAIVRIARDYHAASDDHVRVNDASLFFGGRFDLAANWGTGAHQEHRFGTEVDMRPSDMSPQRRAQFVKAAEGKVANLLYERSPAHYHARDASSYYRRQ